VAILPLSVRLLRVGRVTRQLARGTPLARSSGVQPQLWSATPRAVALGLGFPKGAPQWEVRAQRRRRGRGMR